MIRFDAELCRGKIKQKNINKFSMQIFGEKNHTIYAEYKDQHIHRDRFAFLVGQNLIKFFLKLTKNKI